MQRTVLRIIDRLNVGGPALHATLTSRDLDRRRWRTVLMIGSVEPGEADMGYLLDDLDVEVIKIPSLGRELRPAADLRTGWEVLSAMRRIRPDVVHTHKSKAGAIGRLAAVAARVPVRVHTYHGHVFSGYFGPRKTAAFLAIERSLARVTSKLIALSDGLVDELSGTYRIAPRDKFQVVPLGLDLQKFAAARVESDGGLRRELGISAEAKLVGIVGRMVPVKDHATFVAAAALLRARRPEVQIVFVGGGELEAEVKAQAHAAGLDGVAHFLGWRRDTERIYPALDAVALSSVNEGTPVTLIEAMAAGLPVASTAVGGVADLLDHGRRGELAPAGQPAALADAIERSLAPAARQRAAHLSAEIVERYGVARLVRDLDGLYDRLLHGIR